MKAASTKTHRIARRILYNNLGSKFCYAEDVINQNRKRQYASTFEIVLKTLFTWIKYDRSQNVPITWIILREKPLRIAAEIEKTNFTPSNGWSQKFNLRHNLAFKKMYKKAADIYDK